MGSYKMPAQVNESNVTAVLMKPQDLRLVRRQFPSNSILRRSLSISEAEFPLTESLISYLRLGFSSFYSCAAVQLVSVFNTISFLSPTFCWWW